jgi:hypothetical protein
MSMQVAHGQDKESELACLQQDDVGSLGRRLTDHLLSLGLSNSRSITSPLSKAHSYVTTCQVKGSQGLCVAQC